MVGSGILRGDGTEHAEEKVIEFSGDRLHRLKSRDIQIGHDSQSSWTQPDGEHEASTFDRPGPRPALNIGEHERRRHCTGLHTDRNCRKLEDSLLDGFVRGQFPSHTPVRVDNISNLCSRFVPGCVEATKKGGSHDAGSFVSIDGLGHDPPVFHVAILQYNRPPVSRRSRHDHQFFERCRPSAPGPKGRVVNWLGTAAAAVVYYALGALWFGPLFGRAWDRSIGHDRAQTGGRFPLSYYVVPLCCSAVTTIVIALAIDVIDSDSAVAAVLVGLGVGLASAAASLTNALTPHTPQPFVFGAVTASYHLTGATVAGAILGVVS